MNDKKEWLCCPDCDQPVAPPTGRGCAWCGVADGVHYEDCVGDDGSGEPLWAESCGTCGSCKAKWRIVVEPEEEAWITWDKR